MEEASQLGARRIPLVAEHECARRRRLGRDALQAARARHPVARKPPDLLGNVRRERCDRVVVARLEPHDARGFGGTEPDRKDGAERDRNLAENLAAMPFPDDPVDSVDDLHRLDSAAENRE